MRHREHAPSTNALAASTLPYRQILGSSAGHEPIDALLRELKPALERYRASPPPEAQSIFSLAGREDDLPQVLSLAEQWKKKYRTLLVLGAGGSGLSGKALAMLGPTGRPSAAGRGLHVLDNLDAATFPALLETLDLAQCCFLIISKSGTTVETIAQLHIILHLLQEKHIKDLAGRMAAVTIRGDNTLRKLAGSLAIPVLDHDPSLCGRFSILSSVGLIPAAFLDIDIRTLRNGAACGLQGNLQADPAMSAAAVGAALQIAMLRKKRNINLFMPYAEQLWGLALWWRQGWAESLGKKGKGSTPVISIGTADQHSQLQLFLDGPDDKFFTLLMTDCAGKGPRLPHNATLPCLAGHTLGDIVAAHQRATGETLERHGRPLRMFALTRADAFTFGALVMHFTLEIMFAAALLGINPFDQPAVEESKRLAHQYLTGKP